MADQNTGGDGSVKWSIDADNVRDHESKHAENGRLTHSGVDRSGRPGKDWFTVSIEVPVRFNGDTGAYLRELTGDGVLGLKIDERDGNRVYFNLPIERLHHKQVRVSWGSSANVLPPNPNPPKA